MGPLPLPVDIQSEEKLQLEISSSRLAELIKGGALSPSDLHCCNASSKQCLWRLLLRLTGAACRGDNAAAD